MQRDTLISEIQKYIGDNGGVADHYGWYVGITDDPKRRLFHDHKVSEDDGKWIYGPATANSVARDIERHFLESGCKGGSGGGDASSIYVYAYKITWYTHE